MTHYFSRTIIHSYCSASVPRKIFLVQLCFSVPLRSCCLGSLGVCLCIFLRNNPWAIICYGEWNGLLWFSPLKMRISWLDWLQWFALETLVSFWKTQTSYLFFHNIPVRNQSIMIWLRRQLVNAIGQTVCDPLNKTDKTNSLLNLLFWYFSHSRWGIL